VKGGFSDAHRRDERVEAGILQGTADSRTVADSGDSQVRGTRLRSNRRKRRPPAGAASRRDRAGAADLSGFFGPVATGEQRERFVRSIKDRIFWVLGPSPRGFPGQNPRLIILFANPSGPLTSLS
jgi:hypothetical protein